jgi:hypothetical protein
MAQAFSLLVERPALEDEFEYVVEETNRNTPSNLYIKGPYMMAEGVNKNKRMYPIDELRREVARYNTDMIEQGRAMGELNHPTSADVDLERACHMVTEMYEQDNVFYGKSKVLTTPCGQIVRSLINDGVKVGMSSRALGTLEENAGHSTVRNMKLVAVDCVADPSYPKAFVNGILESKQWVLSDGGDKYEEIYEDFEKSISRLPSKDVDAFLRERIVSFINKL